MSETWMVFGFCFVSSFVLVFALTTAVLNWIAYRRYLRLTALLQQLCVDAWMLRHGAIWVPWSEMTGVRFKIQAVLPPDSEVAIKRGGKL